MTRGWPTGKPRGSHKRAAVHCDLMADLRAARVAAGVTLRELARRAGVTPETVCNAQRKPGHIGLGHARALAHALGGDLKLVFPERPRT